ncbi:MAG: glycosyl transferase family 1, partial [Alphaproteobacteria bacterium]
AAAVGRPTIAFGGGGALETVIPDGPSPTGVLFPRQDADDLVAAVERFLAVESSFEPDRLREHALRFKRSETRHALAGFLRSGMGSEAVIRC